MKKALIITLSIILGIGLIVGGCAIMNGINKDAMMEYIDSFERVVIEDQLVPVSDNLGNPYFVTDREFRILHLTDIHLGGGFLFADGDKKAINAVAAMVSEEKPDLVVVSGDISFAVPWAGTLDNSYAHGFFKALMEKLGVYWTVTFGNHDSELYNYHDRAAVARMYSDESLEYCLFSEGPEDVFGRCNHVINVKNSAGLVTESIVMIDSNAYTEEDIFGLGWVYDCIHDDQIEWYEGVINAYTEENLAVYEALSDEEKAALPEHLPELKSVMFMHIPLGEVKAAYDEYVNNGRQNTDNVTHLGGHDGESDKVVYCSDMEEDMFETILELDSTRGIFYGHDHLNNFVLEYKGVKLSYGFSIDYSAYSGIAEQGAQRGCTVITSLPSGEIEIVHENYYQDKYETLYEKEKVNMEQ